MKLTICKRGEAMPFFSLVLTPHDYIVAMEPDDQVAASSAVPRCSNCGCTDDDCRQCIEAQGFPCSWAEPGLCSRCAAEGWLGDPGEIEESRQAAPETVPIPEAPVIAPKTTSESEPNHPLDSPPPAVRRSPPVQIMGDWTMEDAAALRRAREAAGLSQAQLMLATGIHQSSLSKAERGVPTRVETVRALRAWMAAPKKAAPAPPVVVDAGWSMEDATALRAARERMGLSQAAVGNLHGYSQKTISQAELGRPLTPDHAEVLRAWTKSRSVATAAPTTLPHDRALTDPEALLLKRLVRDAKNGVFDGRLKKALRDVLDGLDETGRIIVEFARDLPSGDMIVRAKVVSGHDHA